jgi:hypothetical protein
LRPRPIPPYLFNLRCNLTDYQVRTTFEEPRAIVPHLPPWEGGVVAQVLRHLLSLTLSQIRAYLNTLLNKTIGPLAPALAQEERVLRGMRIDHQVRRGWLCTKV